MQVGSGAERLVVPITTAGHSADSLHRLAHRSAAVRQVRRSKGKGGGGGYEGSGGSAGGKERRLTAKVTEAMSEISCACAKHRAQESSDQPKHL